jgi:formate--tetrahydrofolate ligase
MAYNAVEMSDWQISEAAEENMPTPDDWREKLGLQKDEILPMGRLCKLDFLKIIERLKDKPDGKYIEVTAITPTPLGEGKSTATCGLLEGMGKRGLNVGGCIRQPSGGPTMNIKGSAAGGGNALIIPLTEFSMGLTGDINDIMNAHNLAMVALTARMQHERNYNDEQLQRLTRMRRLDIDPTKVEMGWIMDFCAQALRNMIIGIGGRMDGFTMQSKFGIAVGSELMAILSIVKDLADPFANIAVGQSSIIADRIALKMFDYHITESGFAADIGFEKFWNVKCRYSGLKPHVSVLTTTIRALKMHGGGPKVVAGLKLPEEYTKENLGLLEKGLANMVHHINTIRTSGINPVVCINGFHTDTKDEVAMVRKAAEGAGAGCAVATFWADGGDGALEFADVVKEACETETDFKFLYPLEMKLRDRVEKIAKVVYGADGVAWTADAEAKAKMLEGDSKYDDYATMMVKTHLSLTHDPTIKGVPKGWTLPIRDVLIYSGSKFLCPCAGAISLMPGTSSDPAFRKVDVDTKTGKVQGLF